MINKVNQDKEIRAMKITLIMYITVFVLKLGVFFYSGVMAILAESLHTLSDIFISGFLLLAIFGSRKKADEDHLYGHGRAQYVAALVASTLFISFTSYKLYEEAVPRLFSSKIPEYHNLPIAIGVIVLSMAIAFYPFLELIKTKEKGATAKAQVLELINDQLGLLASLAGVVFIMLGFPLADPIATILVATVIAVNAIGIFRENLSYLLGKSPDKAMMEKIRQSILSIPGIMDVHELRAEHLGPEDIHVDTHIIVQRGITIEAAHDLSEAVEANLKNQLNINICFVHMEPSEK